jgi:phosphohistidine phosphatase
VRLFVLRHGRAEAFKADDASRALVASGREDVRQVVTRQCDALGSVPHVWVSPYLRAQQTAGIAREVLALPDTCELVSNLLVPEARVFSLIDALYQAKLDTVLLVSHQPLLSTLLDTLCGPSEAHHMSTASLAAVDLDVVAADMGQLRWLVHP